MQAPQRVPLAVRKDAKASAAGRPAMCSDTALSEWSPCHVLACCGRPLPGSGSLPQTGGKYQRSLTVATRHCEAVRPCRRRRDRHRRRWLFRQRQEPRRRMIADPDAIEVSAALDARHHRSVITPGRRKRVVYSAVEPRCRPNVAGARSRERRCRGFGPQLGCARQPHRLDVQRRSEVVRERTSIEAQARARCHLRADGLRPLAGVGWTDILTDYQSGVRDRHWDVAPD